MPPLPIYNRISDQFGFLIFHRGGLTSSEPIPLLEPKRYNDLVRVFMSILSWTHPEDAGNPSFMNKDQFMLPDPTDRNRTAQFSLDDVLCNPAAVRSRNTWVARVNPMQGGPPADIADLPGGQLSDANVGTSSRVKTHPSSDPRAGSKRAASSSKVAEHSKRHDLVGGICRFLRVLLVDKIDTRKADKWMGHA